MDADGLRTLTELSAAQAREAVALDVPELRFDALRSLAPETARILAGFDGGLALNGLESLADDLAAALAAHGGSLSLDGIAEIAPDIATALARHSHMLYLDGLTALPAAAALAGSRGVLSLPRLATLSDEAARGFAARRPANAMNAITFEDDAVDGFAMVITFRPMALYRWSTARGSGESLRPGLPHVERVPARLMSRTALRPPPWGEAPWTSRAVDHRPAGKAAPRSGRRCRRKRKRWSAVEKRPANVLVDSPAATIICSTAPGISAADSVRPAATVDA